MDDLGDRILDRLVQKFGDSAVLRPEQMPEVHACIMGVIREACEEYGVALPDEDAVEFGVNGSELSIRLPAGPMLAPFVKAWERHKGDGSG